MANTVRTKRDEVADQASTIARDLQDVGAATRRMANDSVEVIRETANEYLDQGKMRVRELGDSMQSRVQEQPLKSILIATAVGFLLGVLWVRR